MSQQSLKDKTIKGTMWSAADAFLGQGVTFLVGIVLARLLSPDEYGLIGICLIFNTVLSGIVDSGFSNALIRKKDCTDDDYNTMFLTNLGFSIVLYGLLFVSSPLVAHFFCRQELTALVRATGLLLFFNALSITQATILTKRIDFKTKTKASLISAILSGIVGIAMAYTGFGVWALVGQMLSKQLLYTLCLWVLNKWWPTLKFSAQSFRYMWGFGWKLLVSGLLNNIWNQLYQVVVGKFYSPATLGQYSRSKQFAGIFSDNLTTIVQRVSFPILANIQDDKERMVLAYRRVIKSTMFITVTVLLMLGAVAEPFIYCLIGPKWQEAASYLPLICINYTMYPMHAINLNMLQVQGRSDLFLYLEIIKKFTSILPICVGIFMNIHFMLIASIFTGIIAFFLNTRYSGKLLNYSSWMQIKDVFPFYMLGFTVAIPVYFIKFIQVSYYILFPVQCLVGIFSIYWMCELLKFPEYVELKSIIREKL